MVNEEKQQQLKSFKLKIDKNSIEFDLLGAIKEYQEYYNRVSDWISANLTAPLKDCVLPHIKLNPTKPQEYAKFVLNNQDMMLYNAIKALSKNSRTLNSFIYEAVKQQNIEQYEGGSKNAFNMTETNYRRFGYVKCVIANYISSLSKIKPNVKQSKVDAESDNDTLMRNTLYEIVKHDDFNEVVGWKNYIDYLNTKTDVKPETIARMTVLFNYFINNTEAVLEQYNKLCIERIQEFNGCRRNDSKMSMTVTSGNDAPFKIKPIDWNCGYELSYGRKDSIRLRLYGSKQLVAYDENGVRTEFTDIVENPSHSLTLTYENGEYYAVVSCKVPFTKNEVVFDTVDDNSVVGIDVNVKHMLLATSVKDNERVKGYVNIYKELLKDKAFVESIEKSSPITLNVYRELSEFVTFCPIEAETLYLRIYGENKTEKAIQNVLDRLQKQYQGTDTRKRNYIAFTKMIRSKIASYFKLYRAYQNEQKKYDLEMGYVDTTTSCAEGMDRRRFEHPFRNTDKAAELIKKMSNVEQDIIGCRNNIIEYAYNVLSNNGFKLVAMENLTSSNLEKYKAIPSTTSLLEYHKWKNKTTDEIRSDEKEGKLYEKHSDKYELITDDDNRVCDIKLSDRGVVEYYKPMLYNIVIKKIHFAEIKDKFIQMSNDNRMSTILVPPFYSSQMDSISHKVYAIIDMVKKKKVMKLVNKHKVRTQQEKHINGLNADYNSARNLAYIASNKEWRETFCKSEGKNYKNGYCKPVLTASVTSNYKMLDAIKKMDAVIYLDTVSNQNKNGKTAANAL